MISRFSIYLFSLFKLLWYWSSACKFLTWWIDIKRIRQCGFDNLILTSVISINTISSLKNLLILIRYYFFTFKWIVLTLLILQLEMNQFFKSSYLWSLPYWGTMFFGISSSSLMKCVDILLCWKSFHVVSIIFLIFIIISSKLTSNIFWKFFFKGLFLWSSISYHDPLFLFLNYHPSLFFDWLNHQNHEFIWLKMIFFWDTVYSFHWIILLPFLFHYFYHQDSKNQK